MADRGTFLGRHHPMVRRRAGAHSLCIENAGNCSSVPRPRRYIRGREQGAARPRGKCGEAARAKKKARRNGQIPGQDDM
jgi:hypothetical protein